MNGCRNGEIDSPQSDHLLYDLPFQTVYWIYVKRWSWEECTPVRCANCRDVLIRTTLISGLMSAVGLRFAVRFFKIVQVRVRCCWLYVFWILFVFFLSSFLILVSCFLFFANRKITNANRRVSRVFPFIVIIISNNINNNCNYRWLVPIGLKLERPIIE